MWCTTRLPQAGLWRALETGRLLSVLFLLFMASGIDDIGACATASSTTEHSHAPSTEASRSALGELNVNTDHRSNHEMSGPSKSRLKAELLESLGGVCRSWAKRAKLDVECVEHAAAEVLMKQQPARKIVEQKCISHYKKRKRGELAIEESVQCIWEQASRVGTRSSTTGMEARRILSGFFAGKGTNYKDVQRFVGGHLSREMFTGAQKRNAAAIEENDISLLIGKRQPRSDRLEVTSPNALECIRESIMERTQPSPSETKVLHDFSVGNHKRSPVDHSLICLKPLLCLVASVRFMMETKGELYLGCMSDLQYAKLHNDKIETDTISRASFNKQVPFYVVEQSLRSCLCVHCYKAKLITIALFSIWETLHQGATPGSACTCECDLCKDGGCVAFLPYASTKTIKSMGNLSDLLLCSKENLYSPQSGEAFEAHRSACVSGQCPQCRRKQDRFFGCPQHKGDAQRRVHPSTPNAERSTATPSQGPPGEIRWKAFTTVDARGQATTSVASSSRRRRQQGDGDGGDDDDYDPVASKNRNRKAVAEMRGTVDEFFLDFKQIFNPFVKHRRQYKSQRVAFNERKGTLGDDEVVVVVDFQERLSMCEQDEVQSQHWDHEATTIFPCPIFIRWRGKVWAYSFQVLSDDMAQDNAWVQYVLTKLLTEHIPALLRKIGAAPMTRVTIFTDNCAKQFKCKFHFGWVADSGIMTRDNDGRATCVRLHIEHHYFGACHGKNISDSEGGITKTYARDQVTNQSWVVASSRDLCDKLAKGLNFILSEPTDEEREHYEASRAYDKGSGQVLMTKTWIGEGQTTEQKKTFAFAKETNTIFGREFLFVGVDEVTADVRNRARSPAKEVSVAGCQGVSKVVATDTPGVLAAYTLSCFCPECLAGRQEKCPLIRQGIISGPKEFSRMIGRDDDDRSAKDDDLQQLSQRIQGSLPFGSTALLRVDPSQYGGQDIVPVIIARKAPVEWTPEYSRDGMFTHGDVMVWVHDLSQVPHGQGVAYVVPNELLNDRLRAVPLTCIAGLGQGIDGYMKPAQLTTACENTFKTFVLRDKVLEDARSAVVLLSTSPSSAFRDFQPTDLSDDDESRAKVAPKMFAIGTVLKQGFKAPVLGNGQRTWRGKLSLEATVIDCRTKRTSRRHRYKLQWKGAVKMTLFLAGVPKTVDEGYIERNIV